jgi:hypothetical protein
MHMTTDQIARLAIECSKYNAHVVEVNPCALRSRDVRAEFSDDQGNAIFGVTIEPDGEVDGLSLAAAEFDARSHFATYTQLRDFLDGYTNDRGVIQADPATIAAEAVGAGYVTPDANHAIQFED